MEKCVLTYDCIRQHTHWTLMEKRVLTYDCIWQHTHWTLMEKCVLTYDCIRVFLHVCVCGGPRRHGLLSGTSWCDIL